MAKLQRFLTVTLCFFCLIFFSWAHAWSSWPEFFLSSDCFTGSAYESQCRPSLARGETNLLVVWEDTRISSDKDIFGSRITPGGEVLDPIGIPICTASDIQSSVSVAWGNGNYLVVWQDSRSGDRAIYGARVDPWGNVLDPDGFPISTPTGWAESPDVAWDGTDFVVVWSHDKYTATYYDIYAARVTPDGEVLDPEGITVASHSLMESAPSISYNGTHLLVVWELMGG